MSDHHLSHARREHVDAGDHDDHDQHHGACLCVLEAADHFVEHHANAAQSLQGVASHAVSTVQDVAGSAGSTVSGVLGGTADAVGSALEGRKREVGIVGTVALVLVGMTIGALVFKKLRAGSESQHWQQAYTPAPPPAPAGGATPPSADEESAEDAGAASPDEAFSDAADEPRRTPF